jgi:hypothetical protein
MRSFSIRGGHKKYGVKLGGKRSHDLKINLLLFVVDAAHHC